MSFVDLKKLKSYNFKWKLVYYLDASADELFSADNVLYCRSSDGKKFSDLYILKDNFKINDHFEFLMIYEYETLAPSYFYWLQKANPIETQPHQSDIGFISLYSSTVGSLKFYGLTKSDQYSLSQ